MLSILSWVCGTALLVSTPLADQPKEKEPPAKRELFANEDWYKKVEAKEQTFEGTLEFKEPKGIGFGRTNPYRLVMKDDTREVYVGSQGKLLQPYIGKRIKLIGKPVDMEVEGTKHREIWAARLEVVAENPKTPEKGNHDDSPSLVPKPEPKPEADKLEVIATVPFGFAKVDPNAKNDQKTLVIRTEDEFGKLANKDALLKMLKVDTIDFKKQMIVGVSGGTKSSGGYRVEIVKVSQTDAKTITIEAVLHAPQDGAITVFTHPAAIAVVPQAAGEIKVKWLDADRKDNPKELRPMLRAIPPEEPKEKEIKIHASGYWPHGKSGTKIIKSGGELATAMGLPPDGKGQAQAVEQATKLLKVEKIDFDKQMLVCISGGEKPTGGYAVLFDKATLSGDGKTLTIHWTLKSPKPGEPVTQAFTNPAGVALLDKFDGKVVFQPEPGKGGKEEK